MEPASLTAFHSAVVFVHDLDRATANYALLLGRAPSFRGRVLDEPGEPEFALFAFERMHLELRVVAPEIDEGVGGIRLAFPDLGECAEKLTAEGVGFQGPRPRQAQAERVDPSESGGTLGWSELGIDAAASRHLDVALLGDREGWPMAAPGVPHSEGTVHHLDHVVVISAAIEETRAFYGDALGLRLALDRSFEKRGLRLLFFRIGGVTVEISGRLGAEAQADASDRFGGLAWQTADVHAFQKRLLAEGFDVSEVRTGHKEGTFVCTVRDRTHGVPTLLIQPVQQA